MTDPQPSETTPAQPPTGVTFSRPMIVAMLYLAAIATGFSAIVGVVLAYVWRGEEQTHEWEQTHYSYLIRTFWIGFALFMGSMVLFFGGVLAMLPGASQANGEPPVALFLVFFGMFALWGITAVWFCVRCIISLAKAGSGKAMPKPGTWLF